MRAKSVLKTIYLRGGGAAQFLGVAHKVRLNVGIFIFISWCVAIPLRVTKRNNRKITIAKQQTKIEDNPYEMREHFVKG